MKISRQENNFDCGLHIIQSLNNHFHRTWLSIDELKRKSSIGSKGLSVQSLINLGQEHGVGLDGYKASYEDAIKYKNEYFIVIINSSGMNHFIIIKCKKDYVEVHDPAGGKYMLTYHEFKDKYNGYIIVLKKIPFEKSNIKSDNVNLKDVLSSNRELILWIFLLLTCSIMFSFISPLFIKIVFDKVLPTMARNLLWFLTIGFTVLAIFKSLNIFFKNIIIRKLTLQVEYDLTFAYYNKLATANIEEIGKFKESDLLRRMTLINNVSSFLSTSVFIIFNEGITAAISFGILMWISPGLFGVILSFSVMSIILTIIFHSVIKPKYDQTIKANMNLFSRQYERIKSIENIKNESQLNSSNLKLKPTFFDYKNKEQTIWALFNFKTLLNTIIQSVTPILIIYLAVNKVFENNLTPGTMLAFISISTFFTEPISSITDFLLKYSQNQKNLKLLKNILSVKDDEVNVNGVIANKQIREVKMENVYYSIDKPILDIKKLNIKCDVVIEGNNGVGKSTLLRFISLRYIPPFECKYNNLGHEFYNINSLRNKIVYLHQNSFLESESVFDSITQLEQGRVREFQKNIERFSLDKFLADNKISLEKMITDNGRNFSAGQIQIINILKLLTKRYDVILLDEAMENISKKNLSILKKILLEYQRDAMFIEVSHARKYIASGEVINLEKINNAVK